ncbi:MAG: hypothetical protein ACK4KV_11485 [Rhodocyclaceae bacterium]
MELDTPTAATPWLAAEARRCPTCARWGGPRRMAEDRVTVLIPEQARGPCREGPWHGSPRGPRNACGQWQPWADGHAHFDEEINATTPSGAD